jgi:hypothetical protein
MPETTEDEGNNIQAEDYYRYVSTKKSIKKSLTLWTLIYCSSFYVIKRGYNLSLFKTLSFLFICLCINTYPMKLNYDKNHSEYMTSLLFKDYKCVKLNYWSDR